MPDFDLLILSLMPIVSALLIVLAWGICRNGTQRLLLIPFAVGFVLYNGFAISVVGIPNIMVVVYFLFLPILFLGFRIGIVLAAPIGKTISRNALPTLQRYSDGDRAVPVILLYFLLHLAMLFHPEFKVHLLVSPPPPDLAALFFARFTEERDTVVSLISILIVLITPLHYLAIYKFRRRPFVLLLVLLAPLYIIYVRDAYLPRSSVLVALMIYFAMLWTSFPKWRLGLVVSLLAIGPTAAVLSIGYTYVRLGTDAVLLDFGPALVTQFDQEVMLPFYIGVPLVESGRQVDLGHYFVWLLTLPIPGFLKSGLPIILLNYEISEIVLGVQRGTPGFYVVLPGLVAESIFLYGRYFYFIHAFSLGFLIGLFAAIFHRLPMASSLIFFLSTLFFFVLNRGGIASVAPVLVNGFLLFFLLVIVSVIRVQAKRKRAGGAS